MKKSLLCGDKLKPALRVLGLMLTLSAMDTRADAIKWTLRDATFDDGGIAFGSFVFDDDTKMYSEVSITTTAGTSHGGDTYEHRSELSVSSRDRLILVDDPVCDLLDQHVLSLFFAVPQLTNAGGQVDLIILPGPTWQSREP